MKTVTQEDIRAIHSRLDVLQQCIEVLAEAHDSQDWPIILTIREMLEESQNPFEVKD
jgi:3-dehydroquinate dehydratase